MRRVALAFLVLAAGFAAASAVLCENATHLYPNQRRVAPPGIYPEVTIQAADGIPLRAWWVEPESWNGSTVIALHGIADCRLGAYGQAKFLSRHGFRVLVPDSRGHGTSGGERFTFGLLETEDLRRWAAFARAKAPGTRLYGLGLSMGAGILLQSAGPNSPFAAVVADSPFAQFHDIAVYRVSQFLPALGWPLAEGALLYARLRFGLDFRKASPLAALSQSGPPVLLIHGTADTNVPPQQSELLHQTNPARTQLWLLPGVAHVSAIGDRAYEARVVAWFSK